MESKSKKNINVVLVEPEIPNNTGNIGRTCVALEASLHLVGPMGFTLEEKKLRRAGLDYWPHLDLHLYESQKGFFSRLGEGDQLALLTTKTDKAYFDADFASEDFKDLWLIFGKETKGLSDEIREAYRDHLYTIPMIGKTRSLNLANSVAIVAFEAFRQMQREL